VGVSLNSPCIQVTGGNEGNGRGTIRGRGPKNTSGRFRGKVKKRIFGLSDTAWQGGKNPRERTNSLSLRDSYSAKPFLIKKGVTRRHPGGGRFNSSSKFYPTKTFVGGETKKKKKGPMNFRNFKGPYKKGKDNIIALSEDDRL